jgi:hypothetical protein
MSHRPNNERSVKPHTLDSRHAAAQKQLEPPRLLNLNQLSKAFAKATAKANENAYARLGSGKRS